MGLAAFIQKNLFVQWLLILLFLMAIRGPEGFGLPLSLDANDTIVFAEITGKPNFPSQSLSAQFVKDTAHVGISFLPAFALQSLGLAAEAQFAVYYAVQMAVVALGLLTFFTAFGRHAGYIALATVFAYLSTFTGFGRYLALGAGFKIVTSGLALGVGFSILGLHLRGRRYCSALLAAGLSLYHPSHGFVLLSFLGSYALYEALVTKTLSLPDLLKLGAVTAVALIPFVILVVLQVPPQPEYDHAAWWSYVLNKTSNLTPLQDGLPIVLGIMAACIAGIVASRALAKTDAPLGNRAAGIIATVMALWAVQIAATEIFPSITIAQLALTRATPYAVIVMVALLARQCHSALQTADPVQKISGMLLAAGAVGAILPNKLFGIIPTYISAPIETDAFYQGRVIEQFNVVVLIICLAWWMWRPLLSPEKQNRWFKVTAILTALCITFFGLRIPSFAAALTLFLYWKPQFTQKIPSPRPLLYGIILVACALVLFVKNPWKSNADNITALINTIEKTVPEDGMILTLPFNDDVGEFLIPTRATFLGWGESQYLFYDPHLVTQVWERASLIGIKPFDTATTCPNYLWEVMCRRRLFGEHSVVQNDVWRTNLTKITKLAPVTHVLMPDSMTCPKDRVADRVNGLSLVPVEGVARKGCAR